jgi:ubiquitin carboxyl-terminal hydrolase 34
VEKARNIFKVIFNEYSSDGLMSKQQCLKFHQRCVGDMMPKGEMKIESIYQDHDLDHDGYLT